MRETAATRLVAGLALLVLLAGACAGAQERTGAGSGDAYATGDTSPATSATPTSEPAAASPPTDPPPTPEPPATTAAPRAAAPPAATDTTEPAPTVTEAPEPIHPPETTVAPSAPAPVPATEPPDEKPADGDENAPVSTDSLPGEPDEWGPAESTLLSVVGVPQLPLHDVPSGQIIATLDISNPYESLLKVREAPSGEVIASIDSPTGGIVATGRTRRLPDTEWPEAVWNEVRVAGLTGWAHAAHLAPTGLTDDVTARIIDILGQQPEGDTLVDLALIVGGALATEQPRSLVHTVTRPIVHEGLGEVTVDVLNIGDDSLLGFRLHIVAVPEAEDWMSEDPGPFTLRTVGRTIICHSHRGVTADGLCV